MAMTDYKIFRNNSVENSLDQTHFLEPIENDKYLFYASRK